MDEHRCTWCGHLDLFGRALPGGWACRLCEDDRHYAAQPGVRLDNAFKHIKALNYDEFNLVVGRIDVEPFNADGLSPKTASIIERIIARWGLSTLDHILRQEERRREGMLRSLV
jgi:hypothetical protein